MRKTDWGKPRVSIGLDHVAEVDMTPRYLEMPIKSGRVPHFEGSKSYDIDFEISSNLDELRKLLLDGVEQQVKEYWRKVNEAIENILRNYIDDPIVGEITKEAIEERGVTSPVFVREPITDEETFIGLIQRDTLIFVDGSKMPYKDFRKLIIN